MRWMIVIFGLLLSGCMVHYQQPSYQGPPPLQATSMLQVDAMVGVQQPGAYKVGFMEGCDSGRLSAGDSSFLFKKDTNRFDTDDVYQQGWNDGFNRCFSGEGVTAGNYNYQSYYGYYYPGNYSAGFYYPSYYYEPGYSIWLGYYGYPSHTHYTYSHNYYYTPWYGGHKHKRGHRGYKGYPGGRYHIAKPRYGGYKNKGGGGYKSRDGKGRGHKGGGHKGGGPKGGGRYWIR